MRRKSYKLRLFIKVFLFSIFINSYNAFDVYADEQLTSELESTPTTTTMTNDDTVQQNTNQEENQHEINMDAEDNGNIIEEKLETANENNLVTEVSSSSQAEPKGKKDKEVKLVLTDIVDSEEAEEEAQLPPIDDTAPIEPTEPIEVPEPEPEEEEEVVVVDEEVYAPIIGDPSLDEEPGVDYQPVEVENGTVFGEETILIEEAPNSEVQQISEKKNNLIEGKPEKAIVKHQPKQQNLRGDIKSSIIQSSSVAVSLPQTGERSSAFILFGISLALIGSLLLYYAKKSPVK